MAEKKGERRLGLVVGGAFNSGLLVRLDPEASTESMRIGDFVVLQGRDYKFFCTIADLGLESSDPRLKADPPGEGSEFLHRALRGTSTYATALVKPHLMLDLTPRLGEETPPQAVRTIPMHFAELLPATALDLATVFGEEKGKNFAMGRPLTMDLPICLDLGRLVERSNGIFGQSGTGKSFLARILLAGIIKHEVGVNLIFDMHSEYAFDKETEEGGWVKGLRQIFGPRVMVWSLDQKSGARRNVDSHLVIGLNQIEAGDILLLVEELDLTATAQTTIGLLGDRFGSDWLKALLAMSSEELDEFSQASGAQPEATKALKRKLLEITRRPYITEEASFSLIDEMVQALERGRHIILEFGRHDNPLDYMLVANIVTRRIRRQWQEKVEGYEETKSASDRPRPLMITLEEAHKFLKSSVSKQTTFGQIARELRKYYVTLLVIDQRPSGIDSEVLSQLGTRVSGKLTDEGDIEAVLTGVGGRSFLRGQLESLNTRQEILMVGHAVPMPITLRTRQYDEEFYRAMGTEDRRGKKSAKEELRELYGA